MPRSIPKEKLTDIKVSTVCTQTIRFRKLTLADPVHGFTEHGDRIEIPEGTVLRVYEVTSD